eukprot:m.194027 g.194027  ORF g.194027 m.194027 type:complete len:294 (-) comp18645_c0_seq3:1508-2389(-)
MRHILHGSDVPHLSNRGTQERKDTRPSRTMLHAGTSRFCVCSCLFSYVGWHVNGPNLFFIVINRHNTEIFSIAQSQPGARNDKTIVNFDDFVLSIRDRRRYADLEWERWDRDGSTHMEKGAFLICDGGYHRWPCLQCPNKLASGFKEIAFNKLLTAVRKDVEYCFGRLKTRFRILRMPNLEQSQQQVDDIFATACVFHNMILNHDGHVTKWDTYIEDSQDLSVSDKERTRRMHNLITTRATNDATAVGGCPYDDEEGQRLDSQEDVKAWKALHFKLVDHFVMSKKNKTWAWLA